MKSCFPKVRRRGGAEGEGSGLCGGFRVKGLGFRVKGLGLGV